jgi:predicted aminopeptidase
MPRYLLLLFMCVPLTGCYYMQAASGQWEVMRKREPIDALIEDPDTSPELAARLRLLHAARDFSVTALGLPDNKSYRTYANLERDYVVWNVFAAPEFSLTPKQWCFPVAGCVSYRGYFSKVDADRASERLSDDGFDVAVGGVAAYSTLGNFSDPILSTMMRWDDTDLVAVLFHELAHQVVYVKDDSAFNESFATAVEEIGVKLWLESRGEEEKMADYVAGRELQQSLLQLVAVARSVLQKVYASDIDVVYKRVLKRKRLATLAEDVAAELQRSGRSGSGWLSGELNNARLISMTLYEGRLPSFRALYMKCKKNLQCFYTAANNLAAMDFDEREAALSASDLLRFGRGLNEQ